MLHEMVGRLREERDDGRDRERDAAALKVDIKHPTYIHTHLVNQKNEVRQTEIRV